MVAHTTLFGHGSIAEEAEEDESASSLHESASNVDDPEMDYNSDSDIPEVDNIEAAAEAELEAKQHKAICTRCFYDVERLSLRCSRKLHTQQQGRFGEIGPSGLTRA